MLLVWGDQSRRTPDRHRVSVGTINPRAMKNVSLYLQQTRAAPTGKHPPGKDISWIWYMTTSATARHAHRIHSRGSARNPREKIRTGSAVPVREGAGSPAQFHRTPGPGRRLAPTPRAIATTVHSMGSRLFSCVQPLALLHERSTLLRDLPRDPHQNPQDTVKCSTSGPFHLMVRVLMRGERSPPHAKTRRTRRGLCHPATELRGFAPFA